MEQIVQDIDAPMATEIPAAMAMDRSKTLSALLVALFVVGAIFLKFHLYFQFPINADEFFYLDLVHAYQRGELNSPIQSFHVHVFSWLAGASDNEVSQVMRGREVMSFLFLGTCSFVFLLGRHLMGTVGAAFSVLCYLSLLFTVGNGAAFRSDGPAAFLSMAAVYLLVVRQQARIWAVLAGMAMALACLFTIKAGLYLGLLVPLAILRLRAAPDRRASLMYMVWFATSLVVAGGAGYLLHKASLPPAPVATGAAHVRGAFTTFFAMKNLFWGRGYFLTTLGNDVIVWLLVALGLCVSLMDWIGRRSPLKGPVAYMPVMFLPVLSIVLYRNTFPYYYAFMMPPVVLLCGYAFWRLVSAIEPTDGRLATVVTIVLTLAVFLPTFALRYPPLLRTWEKTATQRNLLAEVHKMFPEPVPYLDCPHMVGSFPPAAFFMGSAGIKRYMEAGQPVLKTILAEKKPVFLLVNIPYLDPRPEKRPRGPGPLTLVEEDWQALKEYFIPHWGPIWVAGKRFDFTSDRGPRPFALPAGKYTLQADGQVRIDGTSYKGGDVVELDDQAHVIEPNAPVETATLRWGDHLYRPIDPPPPPPLYLMD